MRYGPDPIFRTPTANIDHEREIHPTVRMLFGGDRGPLRERLFERFGEGCFKKMYGVNNLSEIHNRYGMFLQTYRLDYRILYMYFFSVD